MKFFEPSEFAFERVRKIDWVEIKKRLMENPNKVGLIAENVSSSFSARLNAGVNKRFRGDDLRKFRFFSRKPIVGQGETAYLRNRADLYGQYSPEGFDLEGDAL